MTCRHDVIQTFRRTDTDEPVMWACWECRAKFVPMQQLVDEVAAEREECAKVCDAEASIEGIAQRCANAIRSKT